MGIKKITIFFKSLFFFTELFKENQMIQTFWMEPREIEVKLIFYA